jgi:hypothetical protein
MEYSLPPHEAMVAEWNKIHKKKGRAIADPASFYDNWTRTETYLINPDNRLRPKSGFFRKFGGAQTGALS